MRLLILKFFILLPVIGLISSQLDDGTDEDDDINWEDDAGLRQFSPKTWPDNIVRYRFSENFDTTDIGVIINAMRQIEMTSCVKFQSVVGDTQDHLEIIYNNGPECNALIGYNPNRIRYFKYGGKCRRHKFIVVHELMHVLGFFHQHSVSNRDEFVKIVWKNIIPASMKFFRIIPAASNFGFDYDYDSLMHYGANGFSINGNDTMVPLQPNVTIGQRDHMSELDIRKINILYGCANSETVSETTEATDCSGEFFPIEFPTT